jgi:mxaJ protein
MKPLLLIWIAGIAAIAVAGNGRRVRELRVCSDPDNLPFSNTAKQGFENKLANLIGQELNTKVAYTWFPERRAFVRKTLGAGQCDVLLGITSGFPKILTTRPYYRSTYVFVAREDRHLQFASIQPEDFRKLLVGVQIVGDDLAPPAHSLARRGIIQNVRGYSMYGEEGEKNPQAKIFNAVEKGEVDVAIVWGPFAGYFSKGKPLAIEPIPSSMELPALPFSYDIAVGVRETETALKADLDRAIEHRRADIQKILVSYGVPLVQRRTP